MRVSDSDARQMLEVVGGFYDAAAQVKPWCDALDQFGSLFDIQGILFEQHDIEEQRLIEFEATGLPDQALDDWAQHYHAICPRVRFLHDQPAGTIGFDYKIIDKAGIGRHPLYQEFLRPYGTMYFMSLTLEQDAERYTTVAMQRTRQQGHVSQRDIDILTTLSMPLQRAFKLKKRLRLEQQKLSRYEAAFHELKTGIIIVDCNGRVEFLNQCADGLVSRDQMISIHNGYLSFVFPGAAKTYRNAIRNLVTGTLMDDQDHACYSRAPGQPLPLRIDMLPIPGQARFSLGLVRRGSPGRRLLLMLSDANQQREPPQDLLRAVFGLTRMETRLAFAIARGVELRDYAEQYSIALTTVRTHLANLRHKMGARSQAGVTRLVSQLVQPLLD